MDETTIQKSSESADNNKSERKQGITLFQTVLCAALCVLFAFLSKGDKGELLRKKASDILTESISFEQLTGVYYGFREAIGAFSAETEAKEAPLSVPDNDFSEPDEAPETKKLSVKPKKTSAKKSASSAASQKSTDGEEPIALTPYRVTVPTVVPAKGEISSAFGYRTNPVSGEYSLHSGIDIAADFGSDVKAAYYGTVERTGESEISGNFIIMSHPGNLETRYYHCGDIFVSPGEVIRAGERIATVGDSGRSTGPHLHFEIRAGGVKLDPQTVLKQHGI